MKKLTQPNNHYYNFASSFVLSLVFFLIVSGIHITTRMA